MGWLDRLERKFGRYCIRNLMMYITIMNGVVFILSYVDESHMFINKLTLIPQLIMKGEVWRLITFIFIPPSASVFWLLFTLYFYYIIGASLEHEWGSFKFNIYYLVGVLGTIASAFLTGGVSSGMYLNLSLIFAFSYLFPNYEILLFFFIPLKMKYFSIFYAVFLVYSFLGDPVFGLITVGGSVLNFFLFFGRDIILRITTGRKAYYNRKKFDAKIPKDITIHKCEVCGRTEKDDPNLEFRYCVDCDGDHEYCMEHLYTHKHIKSGVNRHED